MKKIFLLQFCLLTMFFNCLAGDVLTLNNKAVFYGKVMGIKQLNIQFLFQNKNYEVPAKEIAIIQFENPDDSILKMMAAMDTCERAKYDAGMYHGQAFKHIILGPIGLVQSKLTQPSATADAKNVANSMNKNLFNNEDYLRCYSTQARKQNIANSCIGTVGWAAAAILIFFNAKSFLKN